MVKRRKVFNWRSKASVDLLDLGGVQYGAVGRGVPGGRSRVGHVAPGGRCDQSVGSAPVG